MPTINFEYRPLLVHAPFHQSTARERCLFGAFGSGKTYALCAEAIALALEQPGSSILICRRTIPELRDTTETVFFKILPVELYNAGETSRLGGHVSRYLFPNGSEILFRGIDDWNKYKSMNVCAIFYDEADEFDEETVKGMASRVRQRDLTKEARERGYTGKIRRRTTCFASNPAGHNWLYRYFVDPQVKKAGTEWFKSTSFDNPYLPIDYVDDLLSYPEPWIRRYVLCQFDDFGGQIYEEWAWETHVIEPPLEGWGRSAVYWMGMDPGTRSPTAGLWVVHDTANRRLVGVAEYAEANLAAKVHADAWRKIEAKHAPNVRWRVADPSVATRDRGTNMSLQDQYRRLGYSFAHGPKDHKDRIPALGQLIHLGQFVVTRNCAQTFEAIKNYKWEDLTPAQRAKGLDPKETPLKKDDHLVDCAQYLTSRWMKPAKLAVPQVRTTPEEDFAREVHRTIKKQMDRRRQRRLPAGVVV